MIDQPPAIRISGLVKSYGHVRALDGLDLEVRQGVVYGFLGPNGAGKTTTMRVLTGLIRSDAGTVELFGQPVRWLDRRPLFNVGALIESPAFYPYLSGRDNLRVLTGVGAPPRRAGWTRCSSSSTSPIAPPIATRRTRSA